MAIKVHGQQEFFKVFLKPKTSLAIVEKDVSNFPPTIQLKRNNQCSPQIWSMHVSAFLVLGTKIVPINVCNKAVSDVNITLDGITYPG